MIDGIIDERKKFILSTSGNYFRVEISPEEEEGLGKNICLNDFLEDTGCFILSVKALLSSQLSLENKLPPGDGKETVLVFFKVRPEVVTAESIGELVFVVSMPDSPIIALYHTLQRIFAPTLLKDEHWSQNIEPNLQTMLSDLETNLRTVVLRTQDQNVTPTAIMSVDDEVHFWTGCVNQAKHKSEKEKAKSFIGALEPLAKSLRQLDTMEVTDAEDVLETAYNSLDDLWKLDEYRYPQSRMEHLMEIIGKTLTRFIKQKIKSENIWEGEFIEVEAMLGQCIALCSKWVQTCEKLTTLYWPNHSLHRWTGLPYRPVHITKFCDRLKEILNLRLVDRQLTKLLSPNEQVQLNTSSNFKPFANVNAVQYNPYTEPQWQAAVKRYEQHIRPAEERVAAKLKQQLCNSNLNTLQLMEEFKRYQEIVQRPSILQALLAERETLLSRLQDYVAGVQVEASEAQLRMLDMPVVVGRLSWARQLEAKVLEVEKLSGSILNDLGGYPGLRRAVDNIKKELKDYLTEQFDTWTRDTGAMIKSRTLGLKTTEPVVHFEQGKLMHVNYNPALVGLVQQVRQLSVMGYNIPSHITDAAELAKQFMKQARALQQVATFHNTIGDRMIASQRPMMLAAAVELAKLVREQHNVTWSNTTAVDSYITKLQGVVDRLYKENNQLAHYHNQIADKVVTLMGTDLLRHLQQWKEGLREIRDLMAHVETQFSNTKSWRVHWDHQIYKALEHQYQLGLEALNQHMPEIRVDIVYRQQRLQFSPPIEEIRMKYYGQLKRFMSIPQSFRGVCDTSIFPAIIDHNAHRFARVYKRAEGLFARLVAVCAEWEDSVALGSLDLDNLCREHLHAASDWDVNFKASKAWSQEIAKLVTSERKIDCFTINVGPVCSEIEQHNRKYWDCLASSLYESIVNDVAAVDKFIQEARKTLQIQPQRLDEVGKAHTQYLEIIQKSQQVQGTIEELQKKNKTLGSWTKEKVEQVSALIASWDNFQIQLNNQQYLISKQVETMKSNLTVSVDNLVADVERFKQCWDQFKPREESLTSSESLTASLEMIRNKRAEWTQLVESVNTLREEHIQFQMTPPELPQCDEIEADIKHYEETWAFFDSFNSELSDMAKEEWIVFRNKSQLKLLKFVDDWSEKLEKTPTTALTVRLMQELAQYKELAPGLKYLKGESFSEKHWVELFAILKAPFKPVEILNFGDFLDNRQNIIGNLEILQDLNTQAASEIVIRQALAELDIWEVEARFTVTSHVDCKGQTIQLIKHFNDIMGKVGDHQCLLQSIKSSPNYNNFQDRATLWETRLSDLDNHLRSLNLIQRKWVYLEPILGSGTLKMERGRFERVDRDLRLILSDLAAASYKVMTLCRIPHLRNTLNMLLQQLTQCQKSLLDYLEEKRLRFPRFYFLGDEDLLEILGQANKQHVIQSHLKKLFSGIHSVVFSEGQITAMQSLQGETVELSSPVEVTQDIEEWLSCLSKEMKSTLRKLVGKCLQNPDPSRFPSQVLCLAERVSFTSRCEKAIQSASLKDLLAKLEDQLELYTKYQLQSGSTSEDRESAVLELKLKALQLDVIYHISMVERLLEVGVTTVSDWHWQRQLRFYLRDHNKVVACMVDAEFAYSYEYQGNAAKLVHTPLTDKCYLTLTQAMSMGLGGNPYGPAGTGKTESVKALGGLLGRQVLVFNCDESIDVQSLTRILVGLVKCGAWGCFDEFNRLEEATLSAISMQIHPIQEALRRSSPSVNLLGQEVAVDSNTGIFVTLNPAGQGYAGRQKLPDNLKQLFRPVVMSKPDETLIAQVTLHCEGFKHANVIGTKLVVLFNLAKKLLSQQQHYDWGLRALKTVVGGCGSALRESRLNNISVDSEQSEMALAVRALRLNTLSKLTAADSRDFDLLVKDTFPGTLLESSSNSQMSQAIQQSHEELKLVYNSQQERKCLELYEQLRQRMGVVVVGPSGSGKSTIIKLLKHALTLTGVTVKQHTINAKAMSHTQLLGSIDLDTRQWVDGVLSTTAQAVYSQPSDVECWIVFDGDVDPEWIEALNSVLDDNRLLTLPSGWRIQFGPNIHFLFETHDLSHASPATVSRMGMILLCCDDVDRKNLVEAWLKTQPEEVVSILTHYVEEYFYKAISWILDHSQVAVSTSPAALVSSGLSLMSGVISRAHFTVVTAISWILDHGQVAVSTSPAALVSSGLSLMSGVISRAHFAVALVNGLGCNLLDSSRQELNSKVLEWTGEHVPSSDSLATLRYDERRDCVDVWSDQGLTQQRSSALVCTARVCSAAEVLDSWLRLQQPFILIGPPGCGKSLLLEHCFSKLRNIQVATVHCSAQITPQHILQKLSQLCMLVSSSVGRVYRPSNSERLILHLKNTNLVQRDEWGSNMLTAWLLQVLTYKGYYDSHLEWVGLENVLFVFSLSSTEGISPRFLAKNLVYNLSSPGRSELKIIYGDLIKSFLPSNKQMKMASGLANTMVNIYLEVYARFGSSPYPHYVFTPANITAWCHSLLRYPLTDNQCVIEALLYEAMRQFGDKLVSEEDRDTLWTILSEVMEREFNLKVGAEALKDILFMSETPGRLDGTLLRLSVSDCTLLVGRTLNQLGDSTTLVLSELVQQVARIERVVSCSGGSLVLSGRSGIGRKTAVKMVAARHSASVHTPNITHNYTLSTFKNDLKSAMLLAGVEGEQVYFLLEDYQIIHPEFLDLINSLLSSGEVPGLYQSEELEATASVLKDAASHSSFDGNVSQYFSSRVQKNLHVILVLESSDDKFNIYCKNNPALLKSCSVLWLDSWSQNTMTLIPRLIISKLKGPVREDVFSQADVFKAIHLDCADISDCSPRRFLSFVQTYLHIYQSRVASITETQAKLEAGVSKLTAAKQMVDTLKLEAAEQGRLLADKQAKATAALEMITETMTNANAHRGDMDQLKIQTEKENQLLQIRKKEIEAELAEIQPLIEEARTAVGNIKSEALSEIRSLRAPPEVIRDILEGVLRLMGIQDTSWNSMKTFLAKRGVKEDIRCFDARNIHSDNREAVEVLLSEHGDSFNPKTAKRASQAAAPLAAWVTANVKFSHVLDKIKPLEREQSNLHRNLKLAEERIHQLSSGLQDVDKTVAELKERLNRFTKEAAEVEIHLGQAQETLSSAENLVHKLDEEYCRWKDQLKELSEALSRLPRHSLLAAAFVTYLSAVPQDLRRRKLSQWCEALDVSQFSLTEFLCSERQQLLWQSQGLPADQLSVENAAIITTTCQAVYVLDPSSAAVAWLTASLHSDLDLNRADLEVVSQASPRFHTSLDMAVRFGKKLIIQDANGVEPSVYPVLRGDKCQQDGRKSLCVYHVSRSGVPLTQPHISALLCQVNYATTEAGLTEQLVQSALHQEKPHLEVRRGELLRREEELKMSLHQLQDTVLQELANAHGDILHNKELLASLNETKRSASAISESLEESARLKAALQAECDMFRGLAQFGSQLYFAVAGLARLNNMYRLSTNSFLAIFNQTVMTSTQDEVVWKQVLLQKVYLYMARALFKEDTLTFALHLARNMCPSHFQPNEWEVLTGQAVAARSDPTASVPSWIPQDRTSAVAYVQSVLPQLYGRLQLESESWKHFPQSEAPVSLSSFQRVLLVQALRPDLLHTALSKFAQQTLGLTSLSPPPLRLSQLLLETKASEPVLILTGAGTDPSQELRQLARSAHKEYHEVALGEGQETTVSQLLSQISSQGHWLCLKNLHLMSSWLPSLEHQLSSLSPNPEFRLWLTSEPHHKFPLMLVTACLKVTYEAPRGIKRNLVRSYAAWEAQDVSRAQFVLAWFHAVVQERRTFIPQGWAKLYEFNDSDLNAALHVLRQRLSKDGRHVKWQYIQGLGESAIYGGRVDNVYDMRVLSAYLNAYFNNSVFLDNAPLAPGIHIPHSSNSQDHKAAIDKLPDQDPPSFFGLPANVDRSWQRITSVVVIDKLKVVGCDVDSRGKVDQQAWLEHLSPILNLWKKLNQGAGYIKMKVSDPSSDLDPVPTFLWREFQFGVGLVQKIHQSLSKVTRAIKGHDSPTSALLKLVDSLLLAKTPEGWAAEWSGPSNVTQYLQSATAKVAMLDKLKDNFSGSIDLSDVFHPDVFFSSLRHQASRDLHNAMDALEQHCSWSVVKEPGATAVHGLQLEGATLGGGVLTSNTAESADVSAVSALYIYWTNKVKQDDSTNWITLPLYRSAARDSVITELKVQSRASEHSKWILAGTAFYIKG